MTTITPIRGRCSQTSIFSQLEKKTKFKTNTNLKTAIGHLLVNIGKTFWAVYSQRAEWTLNKIEITLNRTFAG